MDSLSPAVSSHDRMWLEDMLGAGHRSCWRCHTNNRSAECAAEARDQSRATELAAPGSQSLTHKLKIDVLLDQPQQVGSRNLIFQAEVTEPRFGAVGFAPSWSAGLR